MEYGLWRKDVEMGKEHLLTEEQLKQIEMDEGVNEKKGTKIKIAIELRWVPCLDVSAQRLGTRCGLGGVAVAANAALTHTGAAGDLSHCHAGTRILQPTNTSTLTGMRFLPT